MIPVVSSDSGDLYSFQHFLDISAIFLSVFENHIDNQIWQMYIVISCFKHFLNCKSSDLQFAE